jgi:hypothetical protein
MPPRKGRFFLPQQKAPGGYAKGFPEQPGKGEVALSGRGVQGRLDGSWFSWGHGATARNECSRFRGPEIRGTMRLSDCVVLCPSFPCAHPFRPLRMRTLC